MTVHRFLTPARPRAARPEETPSMGVRLAGVGCLAAMVASALLMLAVVAAGSVWVVRAALGY